MGVILTFVAFVVVLFSAYFGVGDHTSASILAVLSVAILFYLASNLRTMNIYDPMLVMLGAYLFLIMIGSWLFAIIKNRSFNELASVLVYGGFVSLFCGLFLSKFKLPIGNHESRSYLLPNFMGAKSKRLLFLIVILGFLSFFILILFGGIPMLSANVDEARLRFYAGKGYLNLFFMALPIVAIAFLSDSYASGSRRRIQYSHLFALFVFAMIFLTGYRSTFAKSVLMYFFVLLIISNEKIKISRMIAWAGALFIFIIAVGAFRRGMVSFDALVMEAGITVVARPAMLEMILNHYESADFLYGSGYFADFIKLLPGSQVGQNVDLKNQVFANAKQMSELAGVTPSLIGEAYMNFGKLGAFIVPFTLGYFIGTIYKLCINNRNNFFIVALYTSLLLEAVISLNAGLGTRLPPYLLLFFWVVVISLLYSKRIRIA